MGLGVLGDFISSGSARRRQVASSGKEWAGGAWTWLWRPLCVAAFLVLLAGLVRVQVLQGNYFRGLSDGNRVRRVPIHAPRGIIYDRNGVALVANLPSYRLKTCPDVGQCDTSLISKAQAIAMQAEGLSPGQSLELDSTRSYPYGPAAAQLIGYVSQISADELAKRPGYSAGDVVGRGGLEEEYKSVLRGEDGEEIVEVDALGNKLRTLATVWPVPGKDVATTIDIRLQQVVYEQMKGRQGAVVVTDPTSGEILAIASSPSFDPNVFTDFSSDSSWRQERINEILTGKSQPLFDRAISGTYPPGSTFKVVTATAGLETGKIREDTLITDPGILVVGEYKFPNWLFLRGGGTQGILDVVAAIQKSNDIFFYRVGEWVGVDDLGQWALKFGLASRLGIDLPGEAPGSFPTKEWRARFAKSWYLGDTYHLAIGQGDLLVTPLQVNQWTSVIANGGKLCRPHVLSGSGDLCKSIGISEKTLDLVQRGMVAACSPGGTAWPLFDFKVPVACKTGTAEFGDPKNRTHAWLTGYAPAIEPEVAVTVLVESGGEGSDVAAPIVKKILEAWFSR